jgi:hypothetical protein
MHSSDRRKTGSGVKPRRKNKPVDKYKFVRVDIDETGRVMMTYQLTTSQTVNQMEIYETVIGDANWFVDQCTDDEVRQIAAAYIDIPVHQIKVVEVNWA